jgi:hypothetical protein
MADSAQNGGFELTFREQVMLLGTARKWYGDILGRVSLLIDLVWVVVHLCVIIEG